MEWRAIEEYDAMKVKPSYVVFWVEAEPPKRYGGIGHPAMLAFERTFGRRRVTKFIVLPKPAEE